MAGVDGADTNATSASAMVAKAVDTNGRGIRLMWFDIGFLLSGVEADLHVSRFVDGSYLAIGNQKV